MEPIYGVYHLTISSFTDDLKPELLYTSNNDEECLAVAYQKAYDFFQVHSEYSYNWGVIPLRNKWVVYNLFSQELEVFYACRKVEDTHERNRHKCLES